VLVHLARTQVHFEGAEAHPTGSGCGFHGRPPAAVNYHQLPRMGICAGQSDVPATPLNQRAARSEPEQSQTIRPPLRPQHVAPMSALSGESTIDETAEERNSCPKLEIDSSGVGVVCRIRKSPRSNLGLPPLLGWRRASTVIRSTMLALVVALLAASPLPVSAATPDPVLEWIDVMNTTVLTANTAPNVTSRVVALVSASVFDAVNGIEPRFRPLLVRPDAPHHASQRAAAIQAPTRCSCTYMRRRGTLTTRLNASLAALAATEKAESIAAGVAWGQTVADAVWNSRLTDGFAPYAAAVHRRAGYRRNSAVGFWSPTPPANAFGATPQIATMTPWVLTRPSQFRCRRRRP